ncbi:MAG: methyltransferase domain-containing protein [Planctomycetota bacterium]
MTVPEAMRDRRLRRFPLRRVRVSAARATLSIVTPRFDAVIGPQAALVARGRRPMPYWAEVWPASVAIARAVMRGPDLTGQRALDLGCGLGLPGAACAARGAAVTVADRDPEALAFAHFNAERAGRVPAEAIPLDWHRSCAAGTYDLILLSDVAYRDEHAAPLRRHLDECLTPTGRALIADPFRATAGRFLASLAPEYCTELTEEETHFDGRTTPVRVGWITPAPASRPS